MQEESCDPFMLFRKSRPPAAFSAVVDHCINPFMPEDYLTANLLVVWTCQTFENNFGMKYKFAKYLKETCRYKSDEQFSYKYFLNIAFIKEIFPKLSGGLAAAGMNVLWQAGCRVLARILKMPVQNSRSKISTHPDLATELLQILTPTRLNIVCVKKGNLHLSHS